MGISVNDYSSDSLTGKVYSKYTTNSIDTNVSADDTSSYLDFEGYLKLLTAQMSNQDFNDSMSDSEFIQQMASYSMMEAISQLTKQNAVTYSASLIGKAVTVSNGSSYDTGMVESVTVTDDGCKLLVNGNLYSTDAVTDVVDGDVYSMLKNFVGHEVELKDGDSTVTGKVTGILIQNGNGYVTIDNKYSYSMDAITQILDPDTDSEDDSEDTDSSTENSDSNTAEVESNASAVAYSEEASGVVYANAASAHEASDRSAAVYDTLMKMLDDANDDDSSSVASVEEMYASAGVMSNLERMNYRTATVDEGDAQSGLAQDRIPQPSIYNMSYSTGSSSQDTLYGDDETVESENELNTVYSSSSYAGSSYDTGDEYGVTSASVKGSDATTTFAEYATGSISASGTSTATASTRKYADEYPMEAAFADSVGTHMADIRFIGNTEINSVIDTSQIIGYTSRKGLAITDIGWCGVGNLGEVVTFADGTQRVEVLYGDKVAHLYTSGNYTLDQLFTDHEPGELNGKLTAMETAIRYHARQYSESEKSTLKAFAQSCAYDAYYNQNS